MPCILNYKCILLLDNLDTDYSPQEAPQEQLAREVECLTDLTGLHLSEMEPCINNMITEIGDLQKEVVGN